jgi:hypothetical protein
MWGLESHITTLQCRAGLDVQSNSNKANPSKNGILMPTTPWKKGEQPIANHHINHSHQTTKRNFHRTQHEGKRKKLTIRALKHNLLKIIQTEISRQPRRDRDYYIHPSRRTKF